MLNDYEFTWLTAEQEDRVRQYALDKYKSRFKKGIKLVEAKDGFVEVWGVTNGPIFLSASFVRELK